MSDHVIAVDRLSCVYPDGTVALRDVSFRLRAGESVALLGRNGSGKTTFVLHLNGLLRASSEASIRIGGLPVTDGNLPAIRRLVGMVFQDADDQLFMPTVLEDVAFGPANMGQSAADAKASAAAALAALGMTEGHNRPPWHLSLGEKRRVAIAGVLAMAPDVLVLDEPTTYLDPPGRAELAAYLRRLSQAKVIITHDASFARETTDRAVFFERGQIIDDGPVEEILRRYNWDQ